MKDLYRNIKAKTGENFPKNIDKSGKIYLLFLKMNEENKELVTNILNLCSVKDFSLKVDIIDKGVKIESISKKVDSFLDKFNKIKDEIESL